MRRHYTAESAGRFHKVIDEDTVETFPRLTVFMMCNKRATVWHLPASQPLSPLVVPSRALCGVKPYGQAADVRRSWDGFEKVNICEKCEKLRREL